VSRSKPPYSSDAKIAAAEAATLRQHMLYGDSAGLTDPHLLNLKGQLVAHYDEAGKAAITGYDFKGNPLEKVRQVIADTELTATNKYVIDWNGLIETILDPKEYTTGLLYDGLNRVRKSIYPAAVDNTRKELVPTYNNAGALEKVALDGTEYVKHIAYNAKGQRVLLAMGNNMMTRYAYDDVNYRLLRIRSEKYTISSNTYTANGGVQQDLGYLYDLAGNIVGIRDKAPATSGSSGAEGPGDLLKQFEYDPLNRLLSATGRESTQAAILPTWDVGLRNHDHTATNTYTRSYQFDKLGNVLQEQHTADGNASNNFTKVFNYHATQEHNKLLSFEVGGNTYAHVYDANGNLLTETTSRHHQWGYDDKLKLFKIDAGGGASLWAHYLYDTGGKRIKKVVNKPGGIQEVIVCIDGVFEECYTKNSGAIDTNRYYNTLHVLDGNSRLATNQIGTDLADATSPLQYTLEDHLGNSTVILDGIGQLINREEYYPFGDSCFGAFAKKRYRYNGKEKDNESGLYNYGARYYGAWTCRFISVDPLADKYAQLTPYNYAGNKPINSLDIDGMQSPTENTTISSGNAGPPSDSNFERVANAFMEFHSSGSPQIQTSEVNGVFFGRLASNAETIFYDSRIGFARHDGNMSGSVEDVNGTSEWVANRSHSNPENEAMLNYSSPFVESSGGILRSGEQLGWELGYTVAAGAVQAKSFGAADNTMSDNAITSDQLFFQFVTGTGTDVHVFDETSWMGSRMANVTEVQNALQATAGQVAAGNMSAFAVSRSIGTEPKLEYVGTLFRDMAIDPVRAIHGSFSGTVTPLDTIVRDGQTLAIMRVVIGDLLGAESATHRPPKDGGYGDYAIPNDPHGENSPFSSTRVFYDMRIEMPIGKR